jgi:hypothetical protein
MFFHHFIEFMEYGCLGADTALVLLPIFLLAFRSKA